MGYDISFHPVHPDELQRFLLDVLAAPDLAEERLVLLSANTDDHAFLRDQLYPKLLAGKDDPARTDGLLAFAAAAIAGYLHPYFYVRGGCLSFLEPEIPDLDELLEPLHFGALSSSGRISGNYTGGAWVRPDNIGPLRALLKQRKHAKARKTGLGVDGWKSLQVAMDYADKHGLGLLEASDVFVPMSRETPSKPHNFRAPYLKNLKQPSVHRARLALSSADQLRNALDEHAAWIAQGRLILDIEPQAIAGLDEDSLERLARRAETKLALASSPHTPPELLDRLARDRTKYTVNTNLKYDAQLGLLVARNPSATPETLLWLARELKRSSHHQVFAALEAHPSLPDEARALLYSLPANSRMAAFMSSASSGRFRV